MSLDVLTLAAAKKYTDSQRVAFSEIRDIEIFSERTIEITMNQDFGIICAVVSTFIPKENEKIKVVWDGTEYICISGDGFFGNTFLFGEGEDTGEPFVYLSSENVGYICCTEEGTHTISVAVRKNVAVKQLDFKYLPTIDFPPIPATNTEIVLPDNVHKQLIECCELGLPICFRVSGEIYDSQKYNDRVILSGNESKFREYTYSGMIFYDAAEYQLMAYVYFLKVNYDEATIKKFTFDIAH